METTEITEILNQPISQELLARDIVRASTSYEMTAEQRIDWEKGVRSLYDGMVRIVVTPTWAKLIDFETTLPSAVEELIRERAEREGA